MGGGKRTRERTLPKISGPLKKKASGLLCRAFLFSYRRRSNDTSFPPPSLFPRRTLIKGRPNHDWELVDPSVADPIAQDNGKSRNNIQIYTEIPYQTTQRKGTKLPNTHILLLSCRSGPPTTGSTGFRRWPRPFLSSFLGAFFNLGNPWMLHQMPLLLWRQAFFVWCAAAIKCRFDATRDAKLFWKTVCAENPA